MFLAPRSGEPLDAVIAEQISIHFHIPIDTVTTAVRVIQHGLGDEVLVGRITLHEPYERVGAPRRGAASNCDARP